VLILRVTQPGLRLSKFFIPNQFELECVRCIQRFRYFPFLSAGRPLEAPELIALNIFRVSLLSRKRNANLFAINWFIWNKSSSPYVGEPTVWERAAENELQNMNLRGSTDARLWALEAKSVLAEAVYDSTGRKIIHAVFRWISNVRHSELSPHGNEYTEIQSRNEVCIIKGIVSQKNFSLEKTPTATAIWVWIHLKLQDTPRYETGSCVTSSRQTNIIKRESYRLLRQLSECNIFRAFLGAQ